MAGRIFRARPSLSGYQEIRTLAAPLGRWEVLRPELREFLNQSRHSDLLIQVYLDEGEIDPALEAVKEQPRGWSRGWGGGYLGDEIRLEVAQAAEQTRPRAALITISFTCLCSSCERVADSPVEPQGTSPSVPWSI